MSKGPRALTPCRCPGSRFRRYPRDPTTARAGEPIITRSGNSSAAGADFSYREGDDPRGSYASTDGHGRGYVFLDYRQNQQYDSTRVTAHETGHVLGLPDHYSGPCSELMSGGGPGTSCTNAIPNSAERGRVNQVRANGLAAAMDKALHRSDRWPPPPTTSRHPPPRCGDRGQRGAAICVSAVR